MNRGLSFTVMNVHFAALKKRPASAGREKEETSIQYEYASRWWKMGNRFARSV